MDLSKLPKFSQTNPAPHSPGGPDEVPPITATAPPQAPHAEMFCSCGAPITPGTNFCSHCGARYGVDARRESESDDFTSSGAEAWLSMAMGLILIFFSARIWQFYLLPGSFKWQFNDAAGNPLAYNLTEFYWADLGVAAFSVVLVLEGVVLLFSRKRALVAGALLLTIFASILNFYVIGRTFNVIGFQIINALAGAFGVYIAIFELALLKRLSRK